MHLSRFSTIAICARIFILRPPSLGAVPGWLIGGAGVSSQSTFAILRTMTNSSRLEPTVP